MYSPGDTLDFRLAFEVGTVLWAWTWGDLPELYIQVDGVGTELNLGRAVGAGKNPTHMWQGEVAYPVSVTV